MKHLEWKCCVFAQMVCSKRPMKIMSSWMHFRKEVAMLPPTICHCKQPSQTKCCTNYLIRFPSSVQRFLPGMICQFLCLRIRIASQKDIGGFEMKSSRRCFCPQLLSPRDKAAGWKNNICWILKYAFVWQEIQTL